MSILVTGGAGYIGSHTVRRLTALGHEVVVLDSMEYGHRSAVIEAELVEGNIADLDLVVDLCNRRDITQVVHFAAYKSVGESMEQPSRYWLNNVTGTVKLVEAMLTAGVHDIVFSSSCSVYGTPAVVPVAEDAPIQPESIYAESKAMTERILGWYGVSHGLRSVSLRYFNAAGASADSRIGEDWRQSLNLIPLVMKATLGKRPPVQVFGNDYPTPDGTCIRDYIHVDDLADAHVKALELPRRRRHVDRGQRRHRHWQQRDGSDRHDRANHRTVGAVASRATRRAGDPVATFADPTKAARAARLAPRSRSRRHRRLSVGVAQLPPRRLRRVALALTLPVEPTQQHRDRPRVESQAMPGTGDQAQLGRAVGLGQLPSVDGRHAVVVVAVHHQQRPRRQPPSCVDRAEATELPGPLVERRREARRADRADVAGVLEEPSRLRGPVVEVGARAEQRGAAHARIVGGDAGDDRATGVRADEPDPGRRGLGDEVVDRGAQVVDPTLQREVALARRRSRGS